jgi:hypothetical protein
MSANAGIKLIEAIFSTLLLIVIIVTWLAGIVLAKGFWFTLASAFLPPVAWYFLVEHLMKIGGLLP